MTLGIDPTEIKSIKTFRMETDLFFLLFSQKIFLIFQQRYESHESQYNLVIYFTKYRIQYQEVDLQP